MLPEYFYGVRGTIAGYGDVRTRWRFDEPFLPLPPFLRRGGADKLVQARRTSSRVGAVRILLISDVYLSASSISSMVSNKERALRRIS